MHNSQYQHRNIYMLEQIPPKKGQHRKLTLEKKILPQLLPRIESMPFHQFLSQVWSSTTVRRGGEGCLSTNELSIIHAPQFDEYLLCTTDQWEVLLLDEQSTFGSWHIYEPVTKGRDLKWDTLPQNQTPSKLFSVLPLESGMFQVTISIIKKWFWSKCVLYGIKTGVRSGVDVCNNGHSECHNNTEKNHLYAILMLLVHLSSC